MQERSNLFQLSMDANVSSPVTTTGPVPDFTGTSPEITPVITPKKKFPFLLVGIPLLLLLGVGGYLAATAMKPEQSDAPTPTPVPVAANTSGWLVRLLGTDSTDLNAAEYVLLDERGKYLGDAIASHLGGTSEKVDQLNLKVTQQETSIVHYSLSQDQKYIVKQSSFWEPENKPEMLELALNNGEAPTFTPLVTKENAEYVAHLGNNSHLYGIFTLDPKCEGICPGFAQFELITDGVSKSVGKKLTWDGALVDRTAVSDRYVFMPTFWEGLVFFYLFDRTALTVENLSTQFGVVQDDYYNMAVQMDTQKNVVYYVSEQTAKQIVVSQFDLTTRKKTVLATFKDPESHVTAATALSFSPSKGYLYLTITNSSAPVESSVKFYSINLANKQVTSDSIDLGTLVLHTNKTGKKALTVVENGTLGGQLVQVDFTNEALPALTALAPSGVPYAFEGMMVLGYRE
jgi:hypothetical protein